jgi:trimethylamine--corrinoid protein Co-methyltransferase
MREVCMGGPGHYLGVGETLARMETDYVYPYHGDRTSPKEWEENDKPDLIAGARARKEAILAMPCRAALNPALDREIRARFPIKL